MKIEIELPSNKQLIDFIETNYNKLSNLNEVLILNKNEFSNQVIQYLKDFYRFDYKGICICWSKRTKKVWVQNMTI